MNTEKIKLKVIIPAILLILPPAFSEGTAREIDAEVRRLVDEAYADAKRVIEENRDRLEELAKALLEKETMDGREVERMVRGEDEAKAEGGEA